MLRAPPRQRSASSGLAVGAVPMYSKQVDASVPVMDDRTS